MINPLLAAALLMTTPAETPEAWRCTNAGLAEVRCDGRDCAAAGANDWTPMRLTVGAGALEVCAYSGCFSGPASAAPPVEGHTVWSARIGDDEPATLVIEETSGSGLLRWGAFANPVLCRPDDEMGAGGAARGAAALILRN